MSLLEMPELRDHRGPNQHRDSHFFGCFISRGACALVLLGCSTTVVGKLYRAWVLRVELTDATSRRGGFRV